MIIMIYMYSAFESKAFPNWPGETKGTTSYLYSMSKMEVKVVKKWFSN